MRFIFLTDEFYDDYRGCAEIEQKRDRPYVMVCVRINGVDFAAPLRSHIKHPNVVWTDEETGCGVDLSKAVVLVKPSYIDGTRSPHIRQAEFDALRGREAFLESRMRSYIRDYKKAKALQHIPRWRRLVQYSTLQYFERYIY